MSIDPQAVVAAFEKARLLPLHFAVQPFFSCSGECCHAICALYLASHEHPDYSREGLRMLPMYGGDVAVLAQDWFVAEYGHDYFDGFFNGWLNPTRSPVEGWNADSASGYADALRAAAAVQSHYGAEPLAQRILNHVALVSHVRLAA